jgi:ECF sigma factor
MVTPSAHEVTGLLQAWSAGDEEALQKLMPLVYEELHRAARRYMARERSGHTLQTTALINEVPDAESLFFGARFLAGVGETAEALETLMRAVRGGFYCVPAFLRDSYLEPVRAATRFAELLHQAEILAGQAQAAFEKAGGKDLVSLAASA